MKSFTIGPHRIEIEDDIFIVHWCGNPELGPLSQVYDHLGAFIAERGYALTLFDLRQAGVPDGTIRRWAGQWWRNQKPRSAVVASYGMGEPLRTVMTLINRALLLFQGPGSIPTELFSTESAARAWLAAQRPHLAAHAAGTGAPKP